METLDMVSNLINHVNSVEELKKPLGYPLSKGQSGGSRVESCRKNPVDKTAYWEVNCKKLTH
jgi:hypothetical protein